MRLSSMRPTRLKGIVAKPGYASFAALLILPVLGFLLWLVGSRYGWFNAYLLPPPVEVWTAAVDLWGKGLLAEHIEVSLMRVLVGFALSGSSALLLAALNYRFPLIRRMTFLPLEAIRVIPPLALVPLLILWFGIGEGSKLAVIILASFFPVYLSALTALQTVDPKLLQMAQTLNLNKLETVRFVLVPGASAGLSTGLRLGFGYAWRALVGAELIAASAGLGYLILDSEQLARTDRIFVGIVVIAITGMVLDAIFRRLLPADDRQRMLGGVF